MGTRQYIGARYVPLFFENSATGDSTWAANTRYEPLTNVTWNGCTYTSKIVVPPAIGNPAENPHYWVLTSSSSERLENLERAVADLGDTVEDIGDSVDGIDARFTNGILNLVNGGTGADTADGAKIDLGLSHLKCDCDTIAASGVKQYDYTGQERGVYLVMGSSAVVHVLDCVVHYGHGGNEPGYYFTYDLGNNALGIPILNFFEYNVVGDDLSEQEDIRKNNPHVLAKTLRVNRDILPFKIK